METPGNGEIIDLTRGVQSVVSTSEVDRGIVNVFATGSTVASSGLTKCQTATSASAPVKFSYLLWVSTTRSPCPPA